MLIHYLNILNIIVYQYLYLIFYIERCKKKCKKMQNNVQINIPVTFKYKIHQLTTDMVKIYKSGLS